ncbi:MAG: hypothetical protein MJZ63_04895 [Muribaculaceae bacterium]|nr:hypothetical protein [Muribaculaceae bacterium]
MNPLFSKNFLHQSDGSFDVKVLYFLVAQLVGKVRILPFFALLAPLHENRTRILETKISPLQHYIKGTFDVKVLYHLVVQLVGEVKMLPFFALLAPLHGSRTRI